MRGVLLKIHQFAQKMLLFVAMEASQITRLLS